MDITAYLGRDNVEGIAFNQNGEPLNFAAAGITRVEAHANGAVVAAATDGNIVNVAFGKLALKPGGYFVKIIAYPPGSTAGEVIAGPGKEVEINLTLYP